MASLSTSGVEAYALNYGTVPRADVQHGVMNFGKAA